MGKRDKITPINGNPTSMNIRSASNLIRQLDIRKCGAILTGEALGLLHHGWDEFALNLFVKDFKVFETSAKAEVPWPLIFTRSGGNRCDGPGLKNEKLAFPESPFHILGIPEMLLRL